MRRQPNSPQRKDQVVEQEFSRRDVLRGCISTTFAVTGLASWPALADTNDVQPAVGGRQPPPTSSFGAHSTADDVISGIDLDGKTALITGCNSGIGFETMRALAANGTNVIGAARTLQKARLACDSVAGQATPLAIELSDFDTIVAAAEQVSTMVDEIDMLILNAGIMALPSLQQVYGMERQFVVNHLGHFLLVAQLKDMVIAAPQGRVVVVSSSAHVWAPEEGLQFDNLSGERGYDPFVAYGQSKLANGLFSRELARRLAHTRATCNSLHPGNIRTNISRHLPGGNDESVVSDSRMKSIPQGAATTCYLATYAPLRRTTGYYFADCNPAIPDSRMQDDAMAKELWVTSEALLDTIVNTD